jgi:hypothetical protein
MKRPPTQPRSTHPMSVAEAIATLAARDRVDRNAPAMPMLDRVQIPPTDPAAPFVRAIMVLIPPTALTAVNAVRYLLFISLTSCGMVATGRLRERPVAGLAG